MKCRDLEVGVVGNEVGSTSNVLLNSGTSLGSEVLDEVADIVDVGDALKSHQVGGKTGNVRSSCSKLY